MNGVGKCVFACGSKHSCDTMILFKQGLDFTILSTKSDNNGKYTIEEIEIEGEILS